MGSTKGTKRKTAPGSTSKTPDTEADKTIDEESGSDANEESGNVVERARPPTSRLGSFEAWRDGVDTWMSKSDAWREKTDDKLKALTDVLLETRDLVRSLTRHLDSRNSEEPEEEVVNDEEGDQPESKLSKSLIELKKFLGRFNGLNGSDGDEKLKEPKEEPSDSSPAKPAAGRSFRGTPTSNLAQVKRKYGDATKPASGSPLKKIKSASDVKPGGALSAQGPVKEEEIRAVLLQRAPLTTSELVATFRARLKSYEDKMAFAVILKRISKMQKTSNNQNYLVLKK